MMDNVFDHLQNPYLIGFMGGAIITALFAYLFIKRYYSNQVQEEYKNHPMIYENENIHHHMMHHSPHMHPIHHSPHMHPMHHSPQMHHVTEVPVEIMQMECSPMVNNTQPTVMGKFVNFTGIDSGLGELMNVFVGGNFDTVDSNTSVRVSEIHDEVLEEPKQVSEEPKQVSDDHPLIEDIVSEYSDIADQELNVDEVMGLIERPMDIQTDRTIGSIPDRNVEKLHNELEDIDDLSSTMSSDISQNPSSTKISKSRLPKLKKKNK